MRPSSRTASRSSASSATDASMRPREKSSMSRPCTTDHSPLVHVAGNDEMRPSATPYEPSDGTAMAGLATMELANIELGLRLGLYEAMAGAGAMTSGELATRCGIAERYAREWLEQQAVSGVLDVEDATAEATARRFSLSNAHAHVLIEDDSEACMLVASANPEDYTNRGRIITPLKDRFGSQIRTHYPLDVETETGIVLQESRSFDVGGLRVHVPEYMRAEVEQRFAAILDAMDAVSPP